jgi:hypothetical protein
MTRTTFDQEANTRFGITTIRIGTMREQIQEFMRTNHGITTPANLPNWQSWDPGAQSPVYDSIIAGFSDFSTATGGIPPVTTINFFRVAYDPVNGVPAQNTRIGAEYGGGILNIYYGFDNRAFFPNARSAVGAQYPAAFGGTVTQPAGSTGAPIPYLTQDLRARQTISHELGHGLMEAAYQANPNVFRDYGLAAGWHNGHLYDAGVGQVQTDLTGGTQPNAQYEITQANWNDPQWIEQPMSRYSLSGAHEDFAEAIAAYVQIPTVLQARSPGRYAFIHSNVSSWRAHLRSVSPATGSSTSQSAGTVSGSSQSGIGSSTSTRTR